MITQPLRRSVTGVSDARQAQTIAFAAHRMEELRPFRVVTNGAPKRNDMVVDGAKCRVGAKAADLLDDVEAGYDLAAALRKDAEDVNVARRQIGGRSTAAVCGQGSEVEVNGAKHHRRWCRTHFS